MATEDFVAVSADDWYQRRRSDAEGEFFRKVADQGPRKGAGGSTRQGIYCLTADGKLLAYKNAGQSPEVMREALRQGLKEWKKLPAERRKPGAAQVGEAGKVDARYDRQPPPGGLIVNVYTRILGREKGELCRGTCKSVVGEQAARDHLWLTQAEWQGLIPNNPFEGNQAPLAPAVAERILRFHLIDNTRGEPPMWRREDIRSQKLTLTVVLVTPLEVRLKLHGQVLLANGADAAKAERGFEAQVQGEILYDRKKQAITRFDAVALGEHWGESSFTREARAGRQPLGVSFHLAGKDPADLVPPQAAREIGLYLGRYK
ncbi:MAG: hypothetical protein EXR99_10960 [Gemmataceae bacterium]|nr:hypothetical protein [Gemmataceae bacterium]